MKKLTILALTACGYVAGSSAQAQIAAGSFLLGGSFSYYRILDQDKTLPTSAQKFQYRSVGLAPRAGYFVADNVALGVDGYLYAYKTTQTNADTHRYLSYSVGPFARYYKFFGEQFGFTATAGAGFTENWDKYKWYDPRANYHARGAYARLVPGIIYFPTPKLGLEVSMGSLRYQHLINKQEQPATAQEPGRRTVTQEFVADFGVNQLAIGASFYPGR